MAQESYFDAMLHSPQKIDDRNAGPMVPRCRWGAVSGYMGHSQLSLGKMTAGSWQGANTHQVLHAEGPLERVARVP